ncbi:MAG: response regulator, partial [Spirochaetaceae bacterium]|nr:response regulator [Spirochaetaceae bacterium]
MQQSLKVMLVDDEVMALNNLKNMIDWEQAGFRIVAAETNPRKAFESFKKLRPRIVLVDIQMPIMNGLELSREILSLNLPVKIVILTSYKDFQYAKRAIEVGISNYLVKHELNGKILILELDRLKVELINDENNEEIIRHRLLRSLIDNTFSSKFKIEKIINRYVNFEIDKLLFLFCRIDT